jgi:hypothetical protein
MEFRLIYDGLLLSAVDDRHRKSDGRKRHKHDIRKQFHPQLKKLWASHPWLLHLQENTYGGVTRAWAERDGGQFESALETIANRWTRSNGFRFVPLVREELGLLCSLEILYLRPAKPGSIVSSGDIDNRLKTLFDALKVPAEGNELPNATPDPDEDPFFALLADDALITHVAVETDFLLKPISAVPDENDARVIITVRIRPYTLTTGSGEGNMGFA